MKAMVYRQYGSPEVLELQEMDTPVPDETEVLVKVRAASVNWLDWHFLMGKPGMARLMSGVLKPKNNILGIDLAGTVEAVGASVKQFKSGDEVFGSTDNGCFAEYVCVQTEEIQHKPSNLVFEEAAAVGAAASTALHGLKQGRVSTGSQLLVNGASGGVGTFAVQIARILGAEVTGVCSASNMEMVRSLGAEWVIDYNREDFTKNIECYELIFDVAAKRTFAECKAALMPGGIYITTEFSPLMALKGQWISMVENRRMTPLAPKPPSREDLAFIKDQLVSKAIKPVIDRCYQLHELADALHYLQTGHARGKILITI